MLRTAQILVVPVDQLQAFPEAFRDFVRHAFVEQRVFGRRCLVAFCIPGLYGEVHKSGVVPGDSEYIDRYTKGLNHETLSQWIEGSVRLGLIWSYSASWKDDD